MQIFSDVQGGRAATNASAMRRILVPVLLLAALSSCGDKEERQPSAAELENFIAEVNRADAVAREEAVETSRAKEEAVEQAHKERLEALN